jgi:hypothetical protein
MTDQPNTGVEAPLQSSPTGDQTSHSFLGQAASAVRGVDFGDIVRKAGDSIVNQASHLSDLSGLLHVQIADPAAPSASAIDAALTSEVDAVYALPAGDYDVMDAELVVAEADDIDDGDVVAVAHADHLSGQPDDHGGEALAHDASGYDA